MKTLLYHLNKVSKERGFRDFRHCTDDGRVYVVEDIIETAGKRYALEMCKETQRICAENATTKHGYFSDGSAGTFRVVDKDSILSEINIPSEVREKRGNNG